MEKEDKKYFVYMHINKINNKKYIGITCRKKPEYRWGKNGNSYKGQVFKTAIDKYGWDNFEHIVLFENLCAEEAYNKEQELIHEYKTNQKEYGYNLSIGGEHGSTGHMNNSMSIPVYKYDLDGNFICEYPSLSEAERATGISNSAISGCCKGKHLYTKDCQWSYKKVDKMPQVDIFQLRQKHRKGKGLSVYQYTLDGNFVKHYQTIELVIKENPTFNANGIYKCCIGKNKSSCNYMWFYEYKGDIIGN